VSRGLVLISSPCWVLTERNMLARWRSISSGQSASDGTVEAGVSTSLSWAVAGDEVAEVAGLSDILRPAKEKFRLLNVVSLGEVNWKSLVFLGVGDARSRGGLVVVALVFVVEAARGNWKSS
jgi:hypothetical protein